jgi:hypothetical protein
VIAGGWPLCRLAEADLLRFSDIYASGGPLGLTFSETARRLQGRTTLVRGFLAPPLKPESRFFVLAAKPVSVCPFCQSDADWPQDIIVVYPRQGSAPGLRFRAHPHEISGVRELGSRVDGETGFVSQVRLVDATVRRG